MKKNIELTKDQIITLLDIMDNHIATGIWEEAKKADMVPSPEHMAFLRRIRKSLAQAKS